MGVLCTKPDTVAVGGLREGSMRAAESALLTTGQPGRASIIPVPTGVLEIVHCGSRTVDGQAFNAAIHYPMVCLLLKCVTAHQNAEVLSKSHSAALRLVVTGCSQSLPRRLLGRGRPESTPLQQCDAEHLRGSFEDTAYQLLSKHLQQTEDGSDASDDDEKAEGAVSEAKYEFSLNVDLLSSIVQRMWSLESTSRSTSPFALEGLVTTFPEYFGDVASAFSDANNVNNIPSILRHPVGGFLDNGNGSVEEQEYFLSFSDRCELASLMPPAEYRHTLYTWISQSARCLSELLLPIVGHVTVALGAWRKNSAANRRSHHVPRENLNEAIDNAIEGFWRNLAPASVTRVEQQLQSASRSLPVKWLAPMIPLNPHRLRVLFRWTVSCTLRLHFLFGGGWGSISADDRRSDEDILLSDALQVPALSLLVGSLTRAMGFDGTQGMHSTEEAADWITALWTTLHHVGACPAPPSIIPASLAALSVQFQQNIPLFSLADDARQSLIYLHAICLGQRRLHLQPVMRADTLQSMAAILRRAAADGTPILGISSLGGNPSCRQIKRNIAETLELMQQAVQRGDCAQACSFRLFPVFATEGVGLESGEGHGPRKELFDQCASEATATRTPAIDISSSASIQLVSSAREVQSQRLAGGSIPGHLLGKPVILIQWKQKRLIHRFEQGDVITAAFEKRQGAVDSSFDVVDDVPNRNDDDRSNSSRSTPRDQHRYQPHVLNECWTVESALEAQSPFESIVVLSTSQPTLIPYTYRCVGCKVEQKRNPFFLHESGNLFAWLNASYFRAAQRQAALSDAAAHVTAQMIPFVIGWMLGTACGNGLTFASSIPPFVLRLFRHYATRLSAAAPSSSKVPAYALSACDASLVNHSMSKAFENILNLDQSAFIELLEAEGLSPSTYPTKQSYLDSVLVAETLWNSGDVEASEAGALSVVLGIAATPVATAPVALLACNSKQLRAVLCGATSVDDGTAPFTFRDHFRIVEDGEWRNPALPLSRLFSDIFWDVLDNRFDAPTKRQLLKFITGRTLLPPRKKAEHIRIELPMAPMNSREFDLALSRLPSSHSCDNVIEVTNTLECLVFGSDSDFYARARKSVGCVILDDQRESAWGLFSGEEQARLLKRAKLVFAEKLRQAIFMSGTYELDDAAVSRDHRMAFEAETAGATPKASPMRPHSISQLPVTPQRGFHGSNSSILSPPPPAPAIPAPPAVTGGAFRNVSVAQRATASLLDEFDDDVETDDLATAPAPSTVTAQPARHLANLPAIPGQRGGRPGASADDGVLLPATKRSATGTVSASTTGLPPFHPHTSTSASGAVPLSIFQKHNHMDDDVVIDDVDEYPMAVSRASGGESGPTKLPPVHRSTASDIDDLSHELFPPRR